MSARLDPKNSNVTAIGQVSPEWSVVSLGDILSLEYGEGLKENNRKGGAFPVYGSKGVVGYHDEGLVKGPGIIVGRKGTIGAVSWSNTDFWAIDTAYYVRTIDPTRVSKRWLYYLLIHLRLARLNAATGIPGLNRAEAEALKIPLPTYSEQEQIGHILSTADTAIQNSDEIIAKTQRLKKGLMQVLFTRGLNQSEFKKSDVGEIPVGWEVSSLAQECEIGAGGTPSRTNPVYFNGTIPWIKSTELNYDVIYSTQEKITEKAVAESNAKVYPKGTLLIAMIGLEAAGTRGRCAILGIDAAFNQSCAGLRSMGRVHIPFLFYYYQLLRGRILSFAAGTKRQNLNLALVGSIKIPVPPISEQVKIASILSDVDDEKRLEEVRRTRFEILKKGLMRDLLTGKVRVKMNGLH